MKLNEQGQEELWCKAGHFWHRKPVRGRKPVLCPEHKSEAPTFTHRVGDKVQEGEIIDISTDPVTHVTEALLESSTGALTTYPVSELHPRLDESEVTALVEESPAPPKAAESRTEPSGTLAEIIERYKPDRESLYKLQWLDKEIRAGQAPEHDSSRIARLKKTRDQILASLERRHRVHNV